MANRAKEKMDFTLQKWTGRTSATNLLGNSGLSEAQRSAILAIVESLGIQPSPHPSHNITLCPSVMEKWKVACSLPHVIRCYYEHTPTKPALVLTTTGDSLSYLEEKFASTTMNANREEDLPYRTFIIKGLLDATEVKETDFNYDIVLAHLDSCPNIPAQEFSLILVYGEEKLLSEHLRFIRCHVSTRHFHRSLYHLSI